MSARWSFDSVGIGNEIRNAITTELTRSILSVQSALHEMLSKTGSGVGYIGGRQGKGSFRTRSSPGEPPAVDTGHLRRTVAVARVQTVSTPALVRVGLAEFAPYGRRLEGGVSGAGRRHNVNIAPRPWIKPTLDAQRPVIVAAISQAVDRATAQFRGRR